MAFLALVVWVASIWLLVAIVASSVMPIFFVLTMVEPLILLVILAVAAFGLSRRRSWAVAACTPMLAILLVEGIVSFLVSILQARLEIPVGGVLAWWALRAAPEPQPQRAGLGPAGLLLVGGLLVVTLLPILTPVGLTPGGPLIVSRSDLDPSMSVDCGPTANAGPERMVVTYRWSWRRSELVAGGTDQIVVSWFAQSDGGFNRYSLVATDFSDPGLSEANRMLDGEVGVVVAVDMSTNRFEPGEVRLTLQRDTDLPSTHGSIDLRARYAHGPSDIYDPASAGLWDRDSVAHCSW